MDFSVSRQKNKWMGNGCDMRWVIHQTNALLLICRQIYLRYSISQREYSALSVGCYTKLRNSITKTIPGRGRYHQRQKILRRKKHTPRPLTLLQKVTGMLLLPYSQVHVSGHDAETERFFDAYSNNPCSFLYLHYKRPFHKLFEDFASDLPNTLGWRDLTYRQFRQIPKKKIHQVKSQYNAVFQIQTKAE
jgi:hypothetical protein